jgi:ABC-type phosphate/phosphonate transport system substrate-binding protein
MEMFYLDYIVKKNTGLASDKFFKKIKNTRTDTQAVLDVFFGESDVCLVPQFTLDLVLELNPSIIDKIDLPHRSGADFIPALVLTVPVGSEDITELIRKNLLMLPENTRGQEILSLFKIQGITLISPEALQPMVDIYNDYKKLR